MFETISSSSNRFTDGIPQGVMLVKSITGYIICELYRIQVAY